MMADLIQNKLYMKYEIIKTSLKQIILVTQQPILINFGVVGGASNIHIYILFKNLKLYNVIS